MKYVVFGIMFLVGTPMMAAAAARWPRIRPWLVGALIATPVYGKLVSINFMSIETYRGPDRGFEVTLTDLIAWALIAALVMRDGPRVRWIPFNTIPMAIFFVIALASVTYGGVAIYGAFTIWKLIRSYALYWAAYNAIRVYGTRTAIWVGWSVVAAEMAWTTVQQKYLMHLYRVHGPFDHSNTIPLFVNLILPAFLAWTMSAEDFGGRRMAVGLVLTLGLLFSVVATMSRAGMALSLMCILAAMAIVTLRTTRGRVRRRAVLATVLTTVVLAAGGAKAAGSIIDRIKNAPESSEEARNEFNIAARAMIADHPMGVGINQFAEVLTNVPAYRDHITVMANEEQAGVAHHVYLLTWAEVGYGGIAIFLLIIGRFVLRAFTAGWGVRCLERRVLLAMGVGMCALHASGLLEWVFRITPVFSQFMLTAGVAMAFAEAAQTRRRRERAGDEQRNETAPGFQPLPFLPATGRAA